ncbi:MAG: hypothetical protein IJS72_03675 [Oscillospiraceae bacterium]|nr:hypothetical protein [Oscillospiraceae bacterium]
MVNHIISRNREKSTVFQYIFFDGDESGGGAYSRRHNLMRKSTHDLRFPYYIVTESGEMGIEFQISYGLDKGIDVALTGNAPLMYLNHAFFQSKHNSFLIKGKVYNEQYKGNTYYESYPEILSIEVESWEIITPIGRDYTYEKHGRLIYPTNYLDKYDVEHGDYVPDGK